MESGESFDRPSIDMIDKGIKQFLAKSHEQGKKQILSLSTPGPTIITD